MRYLLTVSAIMLLSLTGVRLIPASGEIVDGNRGPQAGNFAFSSVMESNGVYCEINNVRLFALTADDCVKAGGVVTHTVSIKAEPVAKDNSAGD